jgi:CRP-like cAMP-binding protein
MNLQSVMARLARNGPEQMAIEAGEIDAIIDYANSNVILFPAARRALREATKRAAADPAPVANSLLAALPPAGRRALTAGLEPVVLEFGEVLHEPGVPFRYVYFPIDCVISLLTMVDSRRAVEIGLVGHEGMVGISLALGIGVPSARALVQGSGRAMRMESAFFQRALLQNTPLQHALFRYKHALTAHIAQSAACHQMHSVQVRTACYMLMMSDRARSRRFRLTHELLANMLGVRRAGVTAAAGVLQKRNLINYTRGDVTILDRRGLTAAACDCYTIVKDVYDQHRGPPALPAVSVPATRRRA